MGTANALHTHGTGTDGGSDAKTARHAQGGLLAVQGPTALDIRTGVLVGPGSTALITGTSDTAPMTVSIAPHVPVSSRGVANGPYLGPALEASLKVNIAAAPGAGAGDRIDVVYFKQQDKTAGVPTPDGVYAPLYGVLTGTAGAGKPNLSTIVGAVELGTVTVSPGATATNGANVVIANTARQTGARGARIPVRNQAEQDALTAFKGLEVYRLDTGQVQLCTATSPTAWATLFDPAGFPLAICRQTVQQTNQPAGIWNTVIMDTEELDTHSAYNASTGVFTVPAGHAGVYRISGAASFLNLISGSTYGGKFSVNNAAVPGTVGHFGAIGATTSPIAPFGGRAVSLAAGDQVRACGFSSVTNYFTQASPTNDGSSWLVVERIR